VRHTVYWLTGRKNVAALKSSRLWPTRPSGKSERTVWHCYGKRVKRWRVDCWQCSCVFGLSFVCGGQQCDSVGNCGY